MVIDSGSEWLGIQWVKVTLYFHLREKITYDPVPLSRISSRTGTKAKTSKFVLIPVGGSPNQNFFIWTWFFLDNSETTVTHIQSQLLQVR